MSSEFSEINIFKNEKVDNIYNNYRVRLQLLLGNVINEKNITKSDSQQIDKTINDFIQQFLNLITHYDDKGENKLIQLLLLCNLASREKSNNDSIKQFHYMIGTIDGSQKSLIYLTLEGFVILQLVIYCRYLKFRNSMFLPNSTPSIFLINTNGMLFKRLTIDVDIDSTIYVSSENKLMNVITAIVRKYITCGNILITQNIGDGGTTDSFHIITEQQFDYLTQKYLFDQVCSDVNNLLNNPKNVKIDYVHTWCMPYARSHTPTYVVRYKKMSVPNFINYTDLLSFSKSLIFEQITHPIMPDIFFNCMPIDVSYETHNIYSCLSPIEYYNNNQLLSIGNSSSIFNNSLSKIILLTERPKCGVLSQNAMICELKLPTDNLIFFQFKKFINKYQYLYLNEDTVISLSNISLLMTGCSLLLNPNIVMKNGSKNVNDKMTNPFNVFNDAINSKNLQEENNSYIEFYNVLTLSTLEFRNDKQIFEINDIYNQFSSTQTSCSIDVVSHVENADDIETNIESVSDNYQPSQSRMLDFSIRMQDQFKSCKRTSSGTSVYFEPQNSTMKSTNIKIIKKMFRDTENRKYDFQFNPRAIEYLAGLLRKFEDTLHKQLPELLKNIYLIHDGDVNLISGLYLRFCHINNIRSCLSPEELDLLRLNIEQAGLIRKDTDWAHYSNNEQSNLTELEPCPGAKLYFPQLFSTVKYMWGSLDLYEKILLHILYMLIYESNATAVISLAMAANLKLSTQLSPIEILSILLGICSYYENDEILWPNDFCHLITKFTILQNNNPFDFNGNEDEFFNINSIVKSISMCFNFSPIVYFLSNFQYADENLNYINRTILFLKHFRHTATTMKPKKSKSKKKKQSEPLPFIDLDENTNMNEPEQDLPTATVSSSSGGNPRDKKEVNIYYKYLDDYTEIVTRYVFKYIICGYKNVNFHFVYSGNDFLNISGCGFRPDDLKVRPTTEPSSFSFWYLRDPGIYNAWTCHFERHSPALITRLYIRIPKFMPQISELFDTFNIPMRNYLFDRLLKLIHFTKYITLQRNLPIFLSTIYDPKQVYKNSPIKLDIDCIQINTADFCLDKMVVPEELFFELCNESEQYKNLFKFYKWLYFIICRYSNSFKFKMNPYNFIMPTLLFNSTFNMNKKNDKQYEFYSLDKTLEGDEEEEAPSSTIDLNDSDLLPNANIKNMLKKICTNDNLYHLKSKIDLISPEDALSLLVMRKHVENLQTEEQQQSTSTAAEVTINDLEEQVLLKLEDTNINTMTSNILENLTGDGIIREFFNSSLSDTLNTISDDNFNFYILKNGGHRLNVFLLCVLSWIIRCYHEHSYSDTKFFRQIAQSRQILYNELSHLCRKYFGNFVENRNITQMANLFNKFCDSTRINFDFDKFNIKFHYGFKLNDIESIGIIENNTTLSSIRSDIDIGLCNLMYQAQFCYHTIVDLTKYWVSVTHPINQNRIAGLFLNRTSTGKSKYMDQMLKVVFLTNTSKTITAAEMDNDADRQLSNLANTNLLLVVDEVTNLGTKFKLLCNNTTLSIRRLYEPDTITLQIHSHLVLTTNNDPSCQDIAVVARLRIFDRKFQYVQANDNVKISRDNAICHVDVQDVNNNLGTQLMLERLPRSTETPGDIGSFMLIWLLVPMFHNNITMPISLSMSNVMRKLQDRFNYANIPKYLIKERIVYPTHTPIKKEEFKTLISARLNTMKQYVNITNVQVIIKELFDINSAYVNDEDDTVLLGVQ
ncbi:hypothetical protein SGHV045 [Glossina pallidipes salivary gland hypertrophy virus]|uniref:Uncharacterized protein n=1 Tax=Glossina hytrovirus (isolate Glossina pallidipes/Ethiopia/Seibersdorf/-) TaxID=379529 RepID=B0YLJ9_GHVS|nr:hypothetical protein SGHV045 [Glossina pallidipes salivary gland hypertrophy virus]ABQ08818.1 hypothetical protein SGHV045 [Glossina pallidipes salivary gland hypertrophy virus]